MKSFCKKTLSLLLFIILILPTVSVSAYTVDDVVKAAIEIILSNEGVYTSVVANDNGAVSLGKVGWHGTRALNLLKTIVSANPDNAKKLLGNTLYNEIVSSSNWNTRIFTSSEKSAVEKLLATSESQTAQDALAYNDIKSYITHGQSIGLTDGKVLVYFADLENQMGSYGAERVASAAISAAGSASKVTLQDIYNAAMADTMAKSSPTRRKNVYNYCNSLTFGAGSVSSSYKTGKYKITAEPTLRVRSGPGTSYSKVTFIPTNTVVTVTEISGDWGKVTYNGSTGWINLLYADLVEATVITVTKLGDMNGNGSIDAADARLVLRYSAKLEDFSDSQKKYGDVNSDGKINASDARKILRVSAKLESF